MTSSATSTHPGGSGKVTFVASVSPSVPVRVRAARHVGTAALLLLPLVVVPGLARPFSTPKLWVIAGGALALGLLTMARVGRTVPSRIGWLVGAWVASFIVSGTLGELPAFFDTLLGMAAPVFALTLLRAGIPETRVMAAMLTGATGVAVVALLQWMGGDPFALIGWSAPVDGASVRMRVYGTLGNPNFVGALMALSVPLGAAVVTASRGRTGVSYAAALVSLVCLMGALVATGSRGAVLGLSAGAMTWASLRWSGRALVGLGVVLVIGTLAVAWSPARPLQTTLEGRVYLWQVVAPHAAARPLIGQGPGAVALRFVDWQHEADARGVSDVRFRGVTDHVHNDYLEALVERGVPGLLALLAPLVSTWLVVWRRARPLPAPTAACAAAVMAGAACALVDFPLARPVELVWWWTAVVVVHLEPGPVIGSRPLRQAKDPYVQQNAVQ
jgi:O-antigen ligase